MGQGDQHSELDLALIMEQVKTDTNGPSARTAKVFDYLQKSQFTNWDIMCFSVEYIASMVGNLPWLEGPAKHLVRLLYIAHYMRFETVSWMDAMKTSGGASSNETESSGPPTSGP